MARLKNATFAGSPMVDVDVDAPTYRRTVRDAIGDTARAYDRATGSNGETETMIHDGAGRGCLLGIPWCNQWLGASLELRGATAGGGKHGGDGLTYVDVAPLFVPPGETTITVDIEGEGLGALRFEALVMTTAGVVEARAPLALANGTATAVVEGVTTGLRLLVVQAITDAESGAVIIQASISVHAGRQRTASSSMPTRSLTNAIGVTDPGTSPVAWQDIDAAFVTDGASLNAWHLATLNRNQHGLFEYLTGWPAGDNASYTHIDSNGTNPARSEFAAHARAGFASEPLLQAFPLVMCFMGAAKADGYFVVDAAQPPTAGMTSWYAPWVKTTASLPQDIARHFMRVPDFNAADYNAVVAVVAVRGPSYGSTWSIDCDVGAGTATAAFTAVGSTNLLLATATITLGWNEDNANVVAIGLTRAAGTRAIDELAVLGYAVAFVPK